MKQHTFADVMRHLRLILVRTRFPENVGTSARAAANFGHAPLFLVEPERWGEAGKAKALPLATNQGAPLLDTLTLSPSLAEAVAPCTLVIGTTARTGGWRRQLFTPRQAAVHVAERLSAGEDVALVFGPEDRGLSNEDLEHCGMLVTIPTAPDASSLNLAQAVLLLVYECFLALPESPRVSDHGALSRRITQQERDILHKTLKDTLLDLDFLKADNPDYFFLPMARFLDRADMRRHEMDMFMGICRQIRNKTTDGKSRS